jgi:ferredoxin/bacterioferritin-associated ferredoxin
MGAQVASSRHLTRPPHQYYLLNASKYDKNDRLINQALCGSARWSMKQVNYEIEIIDENCTGCYLCERICPTGAITMEGPKSSALAVVDNNKCVACFRCIDICADDAMLAPRRQSPLVFGTDPKSVDKAAIIELCDRAGIDPYLLACTCSNTGVMEISAAILKGAHTMEDVALQTGSQSGCLMYCFAPIHQLLKTHLGEAPKPPLKNKWYDSSQVLFDVPEDVADKYPKFYIAEEIRERKNEIATRKARAAAASEPS